MSTKNRIFPLIAGALLAATAVVSTVTITHQNATLERDNRTLTSLQRKVDHARSMTKQLQSDTVLEASGARPDRVAADGVIIKDLVDRAMTWDSNSTYEQARESVSRKYHQADDSSFMRAFLPPAPVNRDAKGNEYPYIDAAGLNSSVSDTTVRLTGVDATDYSYMVLVDVQAKSSDNLGTSVNVATLFLTIDGNGAVTDLAGYASTTPPVSSD